jgi:hypothetical protein
MFNVIIFLHLDDYTSLFLLCAIPFLLLFQNCLHMYASSVVFLLLLLVILLFAAVPLFSLVWYAFHYGMYSFSYRLSLCVGCEQSLLA